MDIKKRNTKIIGISLDTNTKSRIDSYSNAHAIGRSAAIRLMCNTFLLRNEKSNQLLKQEGK